MKKKMKNKEEIPTKSPDLTCIANRKGDTEWWPWYFNWGISCYYRLGFL